MNLKKRNRIIIILSVALLAAVMLLSSCQNATMTIIVPVEKTGMYSAQPLPDYSQYTAFSAVSSLLGVDNVLALYKDSNLAYYRAGLMQTDSQLLTEEDGVLKVDASATAAILGKTDGSGVVALTGDTKVAGLCATVYDDCLAIFTEEGKEPDLFNDLYTLEYLKLLLSGADESDVKNAFITLPSVVSAGTNAVYYTLPDINLGLQTNVYYAQIGDATVQAGPSIVAGQGRADGNYTLVRIFNAQQAISAQFLAYPSDVRGGVQVAAAAYSKGDQKEVLICTAPFSASGTGADTVRIFDTAGVIRAAFKPEGINAPYVISTGRFREGSQDEYLAVMSMKQDIGSEAKVNIYSLSDMTLIDTVTLSYGGSGGSSDVELSRVKGEKNDNLLIYFDAVKQSFVLDTVKKEIAPSGVDMPENSTGIYASADGGFKVTVKDGTFSRIYTYAAGSSAGNELNVGWRENRFYSSYASGNPDGYVDHGTFHHDRTDLAAPILASVKNSETAKEVLTKSEKNTYNRWTIKFSGAAAYHNGYHMWEPCFTHRWNANSVTKALVGATDEEGNLLYGSVGRDNIAKYYLELSSSFYIGTYADGILEMNKMRIYPLRSYLQGLAVEFRGANADPEKLIAVSPVHEQEINVEGSVGDYNVNMIRGFREYMLSLYGSIENINKRFGTEFKSVDDFDAPRYDPKKDDPSLCRGQWDTYGESDFFTQWALYSRLIVNKRIMEAYREALLAGFPPEAINAHQIPEGEAVSGFLGQADTRLSPVETVTVCGTAYGGTRYGLWYRDDNNFLVLAFNAGHNNVTLGEYGSITTNYNECLAQLRYMYTHGVRFLHMIVPLDTNSSEYRKSVKAEQDSINLVQEENEPRTVDTGITKGIISYDNGSGLKFDIVQMSRVSDDGGVGTALLKSIDENGSWEGTVYLAPFHANIDVTTITLSGSVGTGIKTSKISGLQCGDQVELTFSATSKTAGGKVRISAYNGGYLLNDSVVEFELGTELTPYRYVLSNQLTLEDVTISVEFENVNEADVSLSNLFCTAQYENIAHKYFGDTESAAATGGVTFDILSR